MINLPNLPALSGTPNAAEVKRFLEILRVWVDGLRKGGNVPTVSDFVSAGIITTSSTGVVTASTVTAGVEAPTRPTGFFVTPVVSGIILAWNAAQYKGHKFTEIWRASVDDLGQATLIAEATTATHPDVVPDGPANAVYYYWIRFVNENAVRGAYNDTIGTLGTVLANIAATLEQLAGKISVNELTTELNSAISLIPPVGSDGAAAEGILENVLSTDFNADVARVSGASYQHDITLLESEDSALAQEITTLQTTTGTNAAAIQTEATTRANEDSALSQEITTVQTTVEGHTAAIQEQSESIDGVEAQWTVKIDNNGIISGIGLASAPAGAAGIQSTFGINADTFFMSKSGLANVKPFILTELDPVGAPGIYTLALNADVLINGNITVDKLDSGQLPTTTVVQIGDGITLNGDGSIIVAEAGGIAGNDYVILTNGQLQYMVFDEGTNTHVPSKFLRNIDSGSGLFTGQTQQLAGIWRSAPNIICSLQNLQSYDGNSPAQDQSWEINYTLADLGSGRYSFTPTATLTKGGATSVINPNETESNTADDSTMYTGYYSTPADCVQVVCNIRARSIDLLSNGSYQHKKLVWRINLGAWRTKIIGSTLDYVGDSSVASFAAETKSIRIEGYFLDDVGTFGATIPTVITTYNADDTAENLNTSDSGVVSVNWPDTISVSATLDLGAQPVPSGYVASNLVTVDYTYDAYLYIRNNSDYPQNLNPVYPLGSYTAGTIQVAAHSEVTLLGSGTLYSPVCNTYHIDGKTSWESTLTLSGAINSEGQGRAIIKNIKATLHYEKQVDETPTATVGTTNTIVFDNMTSTIAGSTTLANGTVSWIAVGG